MGKEISEAGAEWGGKSGGRTRDESSRGRGGEWSGGYGFFRLSDGNIIDVMRGCNFTILSSIKGLINESRPGEFG